MSVGYKYGDAAKRKNQSGLLLHWRIQTTTECKVLTDTRSSLTTAEPNPKACSSWHISPKTQDTEQHDMEQTKDHLQSSRSHGNGDADQENASKSQRRVPTPVLMVRPPASRGTPHTFRIPFVVRRIVRYVARNIPMPSPHHRSLLCVWSVLVRVQCFSRSLSHARESLRGKAIRHGVQGSETNEWQNVSFISAGRNWASLSKRPWALSKNISVVRLFEFIEIRLLLFKFCNG
jgi:hypothetical protein